MLFVDEFDVLIVNQFGLTNVDRLFHELAVRNVQNAIGVTFDVGIVRYLKRKFWLGLSNRVSPPAQCDISAILFGKLRTMTQVVLCLLLMSNNRSITSIVFFVSKSPVGSSNNNNSGSFARARAMVLNSKVRSRD